ncbi:MAG: GntR family transcriptional regulator, partial [Pseudomonadota bacterium]
MPFERIVATNLSEEAAEQIRKLIVTDVLRPGDQLPGERELADRMGISRTSIRSALKVLQSEGLLLTRQGAGLRVADDIGA